MKKYTPLKADKIARGAALFTILKFLMILGSVVNILQWGEYPTTGLYNFVIVPAKKKYTVRKRNTENMYVNIVHMRTPES